MKNNWKVYCHTNKTNGKKYIGITSQELSNRWKNGIGYMNNNQPYFANAIKKYGWDNFIHEVLFENLSKEDACNKEIELIALYNTTNKDKGYNISLGGSAPMYGRKHSKETLEKFSNERKRENNSFYGMRHTKDSKRKMSYPVMLLNTMTRFESLIEANEFNNSKNIESCINGRQNSCGKDELGNPRYWCKIEDGIDYKKELEKHIKNNVIRNNKEKKCNLKKYYQKNIKNQKIVCLDNKKIYTREELLNIYGKTTYIIRCCDNKMKSYKKLHWMYYDEYIKYSEDEIYNILEYKKLKQGTKDLIICLNNKKIFYSLLDCAKYGSLKCSDSIIDHLNGLFKYAGRDKITNEPLKWMYKKDYDKLTENQIQDILNEEVESKIICLNNGKIFNNITEASKYYGILRTGISACCRKIYRTSGKDENGNKLSWMYYEDFIASGYEIGKNFLDKSTEM